MTLKLLTPLRTINNPRGRQFYLYQYYYDMFKKMDAELLCLLPGPKETYQQLAKICDGLLLVGGLDLDAKFYQEENHFHNHLEILEVDQMDLKLIELFDNLNKPIIGICRGIQVINVAFGGTLYQDLPTQYNSSIKHSQDSKQLYSHEIKVEDNTTLANYLPKTTLVNSYHHQAIKDLASGFKVMAYSNDNIIEAIEKEHIIALQWHPEKINDSNQDKIITMFKNMFDKT